jgi:hypothetical protein
MQLQQSATIPANGGLVTTGATIIAQAPGPGD